uniref:DUF834 domain-containing protein n=1 Tax=Leersia perrieri TaxID=77586 RepID=A0A0D9XYF9_9ORYZ
MVGRRSLQRRGSAIVEAEAATTTWMDGGDGERRVSVEAEATARWIGDPSLGNDDVQRRRQRG